MAKAIADEWEISSADDVRDVLSLACDEKAGAGKIEAGRLHGDVQEVVSPMLEAAILLLRTK